MEKLALNPAAEVRLERLGREGAPLLVVDRALLDPEAVSGLARAASFREEVGPGNHFPGVRAALPAGYAETMIALLRPHLGAFGIDPSCQPAVALNCLQMVTRPPAGLSLPQRLPHFDSFDSSQVAVLHYLCPEEKGGTDFYRHRATGFERIDEARFRHYTAQLVNEVRCGPAPQGYMHGSDARFECIRHVEAAHDRVIAYFSNSLHSGHIRPDAELSADPAHGRLMATVFLRF